MNWKQSKNLLIALLLGGGLVLTGACSEPATDGNQEQQQQQDDEDVGVDDVEDDDEEDAQTDDDAGQDDECPRCPEDGLADPADTCEDFEDEQPARCGENYTEFEFGPGSYIHELAIADDDCCVDFTGDGQIDNSLPDLIGLFSSLEETNQSLEDGIQDGDIELVLEHEGVEEDADIEAGTEYDINFLFAYEIDHDNNEAIIDTVSFDQGTHPEAQIPNAEFFEEDGQLMVEAGPGTVILSIDLGAFADDVELELDLTVSNAELVAEVDEDNSSFDDGITLEEGEIGGIILFDDIIEAINDFAVDCDCLGNPDPMVELDDGDLTCDYTGDTDDCEGDEELCGEIGSNCPALGSATIFADIDTSEDGDTDAFSVGIEFGAQAIDIIGARGEDTGECTDDFDCLEQEDADFLNWQCDTGGLENTCVQVDMCDQDSDCDELGDDAVCDTGFDYNVCGIECDNDDDCEGDDYVCADDLDGDYDLCVEEDE